MSERPFPVVAVLAFVAGIVVGSAATLLTTRNKSSAATPAVGVANAAMTNSGQTGGGNSGTAVTAGDAQGTGVFVNEKELTREQTAALVQMYGAAPPPGHYWYDPRSGLYGYWGREAAGYIRTGHDFGALSPQASNGNTGVFINGREINMTEAGFFQTLFGVVYQGHFWLDGNTGNMGVDGNPTPLANLVQAMQRAQGSGSGEYHWRDGSGGVVGGEGNCTFAAIPGAPVYSTPGCG